MTNFLGNFIDYRDIAVARMMELEANNYVIRAQAELNHKLMRQMATLLRRVADEGDLIGEECQKFLDDFAAEIPF